MPEARIKRKKLWQSLDQIKRQVEWIRAAERLGLLVNGSGGKGSHWAIRMGKYSIDDVRGLVATVPTTLYKQLNQKIFKRLLQIGLNEDDIWRALKML